MVEARLVGYRQRIDVQGKAFGPFSNGLVYKSRSGPDKLSAMAALAEAVSNLVIPRPGELRSAVMSTGREANSATVGLKLKDGDSFIGPQIKHTKV